MALANTSTSPTSPPRMRIVDHFDGKHNYYIHDVQYDFYGKRIATSSSDQRIKVWDFEQGVWKLRYDWKAQNGSIWKIQWAHPEFGQVLASCSYDHTCCIWEEPPQESNQNPNATERSWILKATLVDSTQNVIDIKFAPRHLGLKLATCSQDNHVRIYEALDVMNLAYWTVGQEFELQGCTATCISWNPSRFEEPMLATGCSDGSVKLWQYNSNFRKWQMLPITMNDHKGAIHDINWAPNMGRSYHLIASASKDGTARIWKLTLPKLQQDTNVNTAKKQPQQQVTSKVLNDHHAEVWRVEWNMIGSLLATSGDDGIVRTWRYHMETKDWLCESMLRREELRDNQAQ